MKRVKKIFAVVLAMAMVLGMNMTSFAAGSTEAPYKSNITVNGLTKDDNTTLNIYAAVTLNAEGNGWVVADWVNANGEELIKLSDDGKSFEITDPAALGAKVPSAADNSITTNDQTAAFEVNVGAYVIIASGDSTTYTTMVANTYKSDATYMESQDVTVTAKTGSYTLDKAADDNFVARGQKVTFTVTTTFPTFQTVSADNSYTVVDTPTGLDITAVTGVAIGGVDVDLAEITGAYNEANTDYTIDLSSQIGTTEDTLNQNAGKSVVITYEATVTAEDGYTNTANAYRNDENLGTDDEAGFSGNIVLTKKNEDETETLNGAEFTVAKADGEAISFVEVSEGVYRKALAEEEGASTTVVATNGTVELQGLDEGTYHFTETKAPSGYSINADGVDVVITEDTTANVSMTGVLTDTKLSSLPATGGIGTTVFTIGGVLIMIIAAFFFFKSRKKDA